MITNLAGIKSFSVEKTVERPKSAATAVVNDATIFVSLEGIIDFTKEIKRLEKEINKVTGKLTVISKKLNNEDFVSKAPSQIVGEVKEKHVILVGKLEKLESNLERVKEVEA